MIKMPKNSQKEVVDYELSRYACHKTELMLDE